MAVVSRPFLFIVLTPRGPHFLLNIGGINMSKGEDKIVDMLNRAGIRFVREKTFSDLKHGLFRFDFYIKDAVGAECIIEYNGE
jgi:hypothetical protein